MKITIVRHGETEENRDGILQGNLPGTLSDKGQSDAQKIAERFKNEKFGLIISSDLKRAYDTAKIIAQYHPNIEFISTKELRERNYGIFNGKLISSVDKKHSSVETKESMFQRAEKIIKLIKEKGHLKNILVVGHGSMNKVLIAALLGKKVSFTKELGLMQTSSVSIVDYSESTKKLITFSCTKHLSDVYFL